GYEVPRTFTAYWLRRRLEGYGCPHKIERSADVWGFLFASSISDVDSAFKRLHYERCAFESALTRSGLFAEMSRGRMRSLCRSRYFTAQPLRQSVSPRAMPVLHTSIRRC